MDSDMLNANLYGRKIRKRRMSNFCEANEEYFVSSLVTDRPIKRPTVSQGLTGSRQSVLSRKKKKGELCGLHYSQGQSEGGKE